MGRLTDYFDYINRERGPSADERAIYQHLTITAAIEARRKQLQAQKPDQRELKL